ncbi:LPS translocon maturation chaperone LptM [Siccibacter turicensis]|uniref:LPS-assembly lipoprotein LptM n=1 Tax=Siccibacter turicensis TaxID=357233 RepID=A0A2P8VEV1_9ENTR|nr:lipoprotein [Siccibacter turicensis]PSN06053.1 hypothetical protein C7G83_18795 [Siccibacter turicensis]
MKQLFRPLAVVLALFTLAGCGLKGPLYFPPADKNAAPDARPAAGNTQDATPVRNDRGQGDKPTQVIY